MALSLVAVATPSTAGEPTLSPDQAREVARQFAERNVAGFSAEWTLVTDQRVSHSDGDALRLLRWRPADAAWPGAPRRRCPTSSASGSTPASAR
jgi:hypothetical protein